MKKSILAALAGTPVSPPPIWLMRQAGRHLPEYRCLRQQTAGFLNLVCSPAQACEVTLQPVRRYGMDGSILFSDILVVPWALGQDLSFQEGEGPCLGPLPALAPDQELDLSRLAPIYETLRRLTVELAGTQVTQLGFVGAPWTVATYMIEGRKPSFQKSRDFLETNLAEPLFKTLIRATISYAQGQIAAGAEVIKIFDSWASELSGDDLLRWSVDPMIEIAEALTPTPVIFFPRNQHNVLKYLQKNYRKPFGFALGETANLLEVQDLADPLVCLQGNLSPEILLGPEALQEQGVATLLRQVQGRPHIVNLGHGVDKSTDPARVQALVDQVKAG